MPFLAACGSLTELLCFTRYYIAIMALNLHRSLCCMWCQANLDWCLTTVMDLLLHVQCPYMHAFPIVWAQIGLLKQPTHFTSLTHFIQDNERWTHTNTCSLARVQHEYNDIRLHNTKLHNTINGKYIKFPLT